MLLRDRIGRSTLAVYVAVVQVLEPNPHYLNSPFLFIVILHLFSLVAQLWRICGFKNASGVVWIRFSFQGLFYKNIDFCRCYISLFTPRPPPILTQEAWDMFSCSASALLSSFGEARIFGKSLIGLHKKSLSLTPKMFCM